MAFNIPANSKILESHEIFVRNPLNGRVKVSSLKLVVLDTMGKPVILDKNNKFKGLIMSDSERNMHLIGTPTGLKSVPKNTIF